MALEEIPLPEIGPGEILVRVETCGICHTDLKKIEKDLLPPPRVYGHETAGIIAWIGEGVTRFAEGDRVSLFHHIPCLDCFYCEHQDYAQCPTYKKVGVTAGFEPAGGRFAQYVRVMDWIVQHGVVRIPDLVSFERASFVEPVNTCLKALERLSVQGDETILILGQGPIGLLFTALVRRLGVRSVCTTDVLESRREMSARLGADHVWNAAKSDWMDEIRCLTGGRGADIVIIVASAPRIVTQAITASRPGARIMLFAQTAQDNVFELRGADLCAADRTLLGSYSASVDLQEQSAEIVWAEDFPVEELISHRLPLDDLHEGINLARNPAAGSLKLMVYPQR